LIEEKEDERVNQNLKEPIHMLQHGEMHKQKSSETVVEKLLEFEQTP